MMNILLIKNKIIDLLTYDTKELTNDAKIFTEKTHMK
jgi:hypothetical protein